MISPLKNKKSKWILRKIIESKLKMKELKQIQWNIKKCEYFRKSIRVKHLQCFHTSSLIYNKMVTGFLDCFHTNHTNTVLKQIEIFEPFEQFGWEGKSFILFNNFARTAPSRRKTRANLEEKPCKIAIMFRYKPLIV